MPIVTILFFYIIDRANWLWPQHFLRCVIEFFVYHSLMTANLVSTTSLNWGVCSVLYSNLVFSFSHTSWNFDSCYPVLSQHKYLTGVPREVIFQRILPFLWQLQLHICKETPRITAVFVYYANPLFVPNKLSRNGPAISTTIISPGFDTLWDVFFLTTHAFAFDLA